MSIKRLLFTVVVGVVAMAGLSCVAPDPGTGELAQEIAPPPPMSLTVTNVPSGATPAQQLSWTASAGATEYIVSRGTAGPGSETTYTTCCTSGQVTFLANHLTAGTNYCWTVKAVNAGFEKSAPSNEVCLTTLAAQVPAVPQNVVAQASSSSRINVTWDATTDAVRYNINQSVNGGAYSRVATISASTMPAYTAANLTAGTNYCYTIENVTNYGTSTASSPPACDTTFLAGLEGYWRLTETSGTSAADSSGFARNLTVSGSFSAATPQAPIDPPLGNNEPHFDSGTGTGAAASAAGIGAFRLLSPFTVMAWVYVPAAGPAQIMGMRASGNCTGTGTGWELSQTASGLSFLGWSGSLSFGQSLPVGAWTHVAVTFSSGANATGTMIAYINGAQVATGTYTARNSLTGALELGHLGGCAGGQAWLDEVQIYSRVLAPTEIATFGTRPAAPTALSITKNTSQSQTLSWTAPAAGADRWVILRGLSSGTETHYTHAPNPPTTFAASHLTSNTAYFWEVETVQNHLISVPSSEVTATTLAGPVPPTGITATAVSQTRIDVSWTAVANTTDYFIYQATSAAGPFTIKGHVTPPTVTFAATGLTANTTYYYEVSDKDTGGQTSALSSPPVSATTNP